MHFVEGQGVLGRIRFVDGEFPAYDRTWSVRIDNEMVVEIMECLTVDTNREILIRNKKDTMKLSKQVAEESENMRHQRYLDAIENDDTLYLNRIYNSLSMKDLLRLLIEKVKNIFSTDEKDCDNNGEFAALLLLSFPCSFTINTIILHFSLLQNQPKETV